MRLSSSIFIFMALFSLNALAVEKPIKVWPAIAPGEKGDIGEETATPSKPGQKQVLIYLILK